MDIKDLDKFNPWWTTGKVREEWLKPFKRKLYFEIAKYMDERQILLIQGLRRMGKTTIMFQMIQNLLSKTDSKHIFYFSFDETVFDLEEVLENYEKLILGKNFANTNDKIFCFLDEIQKIDDWESKLKVQYDLYPNVKFIISGSASVRLRKRIKRKLGWEDV